MESKNEKAIIFGLIFIIGIFVITIYRPEIDFDKIKEFFSKSEKSDTTIEEIDETPEFSVISITELQSKLEKVSDELFVIDIREEDDYNIEHIVGSINLPPSKMTDTPTKISKPGVKEVVIVGYGVTDDDLSAKMVGKIMDGGIKDVKVLSAGFSEWQKSGRNLINWGDPSSFVQQSKVDYIDTDSLNRLAAQDAGLVILDVRDMDQYKSGHLPGAINIPLDELEVKRDEITKSRSIVVYGTSELESFQAGVRLYDLGFPITKVYREGIDKWKEKTLPTEN